MTGILLGIPFSLLGVPFSKCTKLKFIWIYDMVEQEKFKDVVYL